MTQMDQSSAELCRHGLARIAERDCVSIPEATVFALADLTSVEGYDPADMEQLVTVQDILSGYDQLNPGATYVEGLRAIARVNQVLRDTATTIEQNLRNGHAEEHIPPTRAAFTFLTGKRI